MKAKDLIGKKVILDVKIGEEDLTGTIIEAYDPPEGSHGVGIDCRIHWCDDSITWADAGSLFYEEDETNEEEK